MTPIYHPFPLLKVRLIPLLAPRTLIRSTHFFVSHRALLSFVTSTEMPKGLKTPFQRDHDMQYELEVIERDPSTSTVLAALCRFCLKFVRKAKPGTKRQCMNNVQVFKAPFCTDAYKRHHDNVHHEKCQHFWPIRRNRRQYSSMLQSTTQAH